MQVCVIISCQPHKKHFKTSGSPGNKCKSLTMHNESSAPNLSEELCKKLTLTTNRHTLKVHSIDRQCSYQVIQFRHFYKAKSFHQIAKVQINQTNYYQIQMSVLERTLYNSKKFHLSSTAGQVFSIVMI